MAMTIAAYLKATGLMQRELSKKLKISPAHMNNILHGRRFPGRKLGMQIIAESGGAITTNDLWVNLGSKKRRSR